MKSLKAHRILAILVLSLFAAILILFTIELKRPRREYLVKTDLHIELNDFFTPGEEILIWTISGLPVLFGILALVWNQKRRKLHSSRGLYAATLIAGLLCTAGLTLGIIQLWSVFAENYMQPDTWLKQASDFLFPPDHTEKGLVLAQDICMSVLTGLVFTTTLLTLLIRNQPQNTNPHPATAVS